MCFGFLVFWNVILLVGFGCFVVLDLVQVELVGVFSLGFCLVWLFVCLIWDHVLFCFLLNCKFGYLVFVVLG